MGGFPAQPEEEVWGLLVEVGLLYPIFCCCSCGFSVIVLLLCFPFDLSLQGLDLLKQASSLCKEASRLEVEAQCLEMEGLANMEAAVAGSEVEGFYGPLRGAILHSSLPTSSPPPKKACHAPSATVSHLPPQESTGPEASAPADQALESASLAVPPASEEEIPAHMQPLCIQLGGIKRVYRCQVEGCKEGPSTSHTTICAHIQKVHLGVGLVCPLCGKSFFNPDTFWCHKKGHTNL